MSKFWELWDSRLGVLKKKHHLGVALRVNNREYYKREGGGFPQVWAMVSLMSLCMFMACSWTKSAQKML